MGLSVVPMNVTSLAAWLAERGTEFASIEEAITAGNLALQSGGPGLAGTALRVVTGAGSSAVDAGVTASNIVDFAAAQQMAATGAEVSSSAIGAVQTASGGARITGVLGVELGTVASAVAPLLGVSLGIDLYKNNPEFWTKLSQKLLPFCWPDTTKIPSWAEVVDGTWVTTIPKKVYDAIKALFDEEEVGPSEIYHVVDQSGDAIGSYGKAGGWKRNSYWYKATATGETFYTTRYFGTGPYSVTALYFTLDGSIPTTGTIKSNSDSSPHDISSGSTYTYDGKSVRYVSYYSGGVNSLDDIDGPMAPGTDIYGDKRVAWNLAHGGTATSGNYPQGTASWTGNTPTEITIGKPAYIDQNTTEETIEVAFPPEIVPTPRPQPGVQPTPLEIPNSPSANPDEFPDPDKVTDPDIQVEPHIMPTPIPWTDLTPQPDPNPQPDLNPDVDPEPQPQPDPTPFDIVPYPDGIVPFPGMPDTQPAFAQNVGLVTVYHPTASQLYAFERWLWVTYQDAEIQKIWNNPFDGIITLFELYCTPTDIGTRNIHSGFLDSGIESATVGRYTEINCGTMAVPEYYGNYLDYSPYTRAYIYLPFIGIQELNADDIIGHAVNVTYRIDEYNGSCIAMITVAKTTTVNGERKDYSNIMYQFSGNCAVELPITGGSQASIKAGMMTANAYQQAAQVSALGQLLGGLGSLLSTNPLGGLIGGISGASATAAYGQAQAISNMVSNKSVVSHSGGFGSSHGALGVKKPYITIVRPKQVRVPNYNELYGYPAHKQVQVGACTGFLRCLEVHVVSATATDDEKSIIESMMKSGVYVTE